MITFAKLLAEEIIVDFHIVGVNAKTVTIITDKLNNASNLQGFLSCCESRLTRYCRMNDVDELRMLWMNQCGVNEIRMNSGFKFGPIKYCLW